MLPLQEEFLGLLPIPVILHPLNSIVLSAIFCAIYRFLLRSTLILILMSLSSSSSSCSLVHPAQCLANFHVVKQEACVCVCVCVCVWIMGRKTNSNHYLWKYHNYPNQNKMHR